MTNKEQLTEQIYEAFKEVKLEDGIGLWEAQGHDDRLSVEQCKKLRAKDEIAHWSKIALVDLYKCSSSLSFFDAKGMRFHVPKFLLFALDVFKKEEDKLRKQGLIEGCHAPDIEYRLISVLSYLNDKSEHGKRMIEHHRNIFSLLNKQQVTCVIGFLKYRMIEIEDYYRGSYAKQFGTSPSAIKHDKDYIQLERGVEYWENNYQELTNKL